MKTLLITGATGSLGKQIGKALGKKYKVIGLSSSISGHDKFEIKKFDLVNDNSIDISEIDYCLHLAALTDSKLCSGNPQLAHKINVLGTYKILELCKKANCKKFIYASTGHVYGFSKTELEERDKPNPFDVYSSTKYFGERAAKEYGGFFPVVILRLFYVYGPGTNMNILVNRLIHKVIHKKPIFLNNNNEPFVNPIFGTDLIRAMEKTIEHAKSSMIYNVAGKEKKNIRQLSEMIASELGVQPIFEKTGKKVGNMVANIDKLKRELKFIPQVGLKKGIGLTIDSICQKQY